MVNEAEKYKEEDEKQKDRVVAKNGLESYAFNLKQTVEDDKVKDKISDDDKATILNKAKEVLDWLDSNQVSCVLHCQISAVLFQSEMHGWFLQKSVFSTGISRDRLMHFNFFFIKHAQYVFDYCSVMILNHPV